jgi:hypothetical protein
VLVVGIAALCYFIQLNWTGPNTEDKFEWLSDKGDEIKLELALDAENLSPLVEGVQWLLLARAVFIQNCLKFNHFKVIFCGSLFKDDLTEAKFISRLLQHGGVSDAFMCIKMFWKTLLLNYIP